MENKTILPKIQGFNEVKLGSVQNFLIDGNSISFDRLDGAKFYIIYKDQNAINYDNSQIVDIIGGTSDIISWKDTEMVILSMMLFHFHIQIRLVNLQLM